MQLAPDTATVQDADGTWRTLDAAQIAPGAIVRVKPGERIGLDGEVVAGRSTVNQAPITGESPSTRPPATRCSPARSTIGFVRLSCDGGRVELDARTDHPCGRAGAGREGADAALRRPLRARLHADRVRDRAAGGRRPPLVTGGAWHDWIYRRWCCW
jgi:Cd2+/Zn2+-exporting ATPase